MGLAIVAGAIGSIGGPRGHPSGGREHDVPYDGRRGSAETRRSTAPSVSETDALIDLLEERTLRAKRSRPWPSGG